MGNNKKIILFVSIFILIAGIIFYQFLSSSFDQKHHLAIIEKSPITKDAFEREMAKYPGGYSTIEQRQVLLEKMVRAEMLYALALKREYDKDPKIRESIKRMITNRLRQEILEPRLEKVEVSNKELMDYYKRHKSEFMIPRKVRAALIKIEIPAGSSSEKKAELLKKAEMVRNEALKLPAETSSFGSVAVKYSDHLPTRYRGGDIGWIREGEEIKGLEKEVCAAIFSLTEPGEIKFMTTSSGAFFLLKLIEVKNRSMKPFNKVKGIIHHSLLKQKKEEVATLFYKEIKKEVPVWVNQLLLDSMKGPEKTLKDKPSEPPGLPMR